MSNSDSIDVQAVFNKVIEHNYYVLNEHSYMCCSLSRAYSLGLITTQEYDVAHNAIRRYVNGFTTLVSALIFNGLPAGKQVRMAIYKDWANKPELKR